MHGVCVCLCWCIAVLGDVVVAAIVWFWCGWCVVHCMCVVYCDKALSLFYVGV